jgi:hypothetical protein
MRQRVEADGEWFFAGGCSFLLFSLFQRKCTLVLFSLDFSISVPMFLIAYFLPWSFL